MINIEKKAIAGLYESIEATRMSHLNSDGNFEESMGLLSKLIKAGDDHAKSLRGIVVWVTIDAPRYFWHEFVTYRIGCEQLGSESTMHGQNMRYVPGTEVRELSNDLMLRKANIPEGLMQKRMFLISYQTLRRIYKQRKSHRLPEWREFCDWIKTLPWSEQLITVGLD